MISQFKSLISLLDYFKEEETCKVYLAQKRWGNTPSCPHCGNVGAYITNRGYKCKAKECHKKFTVTTGTVFQDTKISLRLWYAAMYLCTAHKKGISSLQLSRDLNITQKTAWFLLHRIREMLKTNNEVQTLSGEIEVDETYCGGEEKNKHEKFRKHKMGRMVEKTPVLGIVQRNGAVKAFVMDNVTSASIHTLLNKTVDMKTSILYTDGFTSYNWSGRFFSKHIAVKHNNDYTTFGKNHTNSVEGFFSHLKRTLRGTYHWASKKHLQRYCDEMAYRFSTRIVTDSQRFADCFVGCNTRLTYANLISKNG